VVGVASAVAEIKEITSVNLTESKTDLTTDTGKSITAGDRAMVIGSDAEDMDNGSS